MEDIRLRKVLQRITDVIVKKTATSRNSENCEREEKKNSAGSLQRNRRTTQGQEGHRRDVGRMPPLCSGYPTAANAEASSAYFEAACSLSAWSDWMWLNLERCQETGDELLCEAIGTGMVAFLRSGTSRPDRGVSELLPSDIFFATM